MYLIYFCFLYICKYIREFSTYILLHYLLIMSSFLKIRIKFDYLLIKTIVISTMVGLNTSIVMGKSSDIDFSLKNNDFVEYFPYINPTPGHIPIVACDPAYQDEIPTVSDLNKAAFCGFNLVQRAYDDSIINKVISNVNASSVQLVARNYNLFQPDSVSHQLMKLLSNRVKSTFFHGSIIKNLYNYLVQD